MPDVRNAAGRLTRGSKEVRMVLFTLAFAALVLGAAAFFIAVQANSHNAQVAVNDARSAAGQAASAAAQAKAAAATAAAARADLCTFLNVIRTTPLTDDREAVQAQRLYVLYRCGQ